MSKEGETDNLEAQVKSGVWSVRPCQLYKEEYNDCCSIKARFQQYFVQGDSADCTPWENDYRNCVKFEDGDLQAGKQVIDSETKRRRDRMRPHYQNNVWTKREAPPADWSKELPEYLQKEYENSFLSIKAKEMKGIKLAVGAQPSESTFCSIM
ncbi:unnamed protein product [Diamesa hyperborea]